MKQVLTGFLLFVLLALALPLGYHTDDPGESDSPEIDHWWNAA